MSVAHRKSCGKGKCGESLPLEALDDDLFNIHGALIGRSRAASDSCMSFYPGWGSKQAAWMKGRLELCDNAGKRRVGTATAMECLPSRVERQRLLPEDGNRRGKTPATL